MILVHKDLHNLKVLLDLWDLRVVVDLQDLQVIQHKDLKDLKD